MISTKQHTIVAFEVDCYLSNFKTSVIYPENRKFAAGFTLIELLVVIAIIGILAAMIFPVLGQAKIRAQGTQCLSNLKQMSLGWQAYADENDGKYPVNASLGGIYPTVGEDAVNPSWVAGILSIYHTDPDNYNTDKLVGPTYNPFGSIGVYTKNPALYHCPGDLSVDPGNSTLRVRSISMNCWINPGKINEHDSECWTMPYAKFAQTGDFGITSPSDIFVFLDESATVDEGFLRVCVSGYNADGTIDESQLNLYNIPATYHNKCGSFSYADGHAELRRWLGGTTLDDDDIIWLMRHATVPKVVN